MIRAVHEVGLGATMLGGGMIGLQFAQLKAQLGPLLNGVVAYDLYVPEPTMKFSRRRAVPESLSPACGSTRRRSARALPSALRLRRDADPRSSGQSSRLSRRREARRPYPQIDLRYRGRSDHVWQARRM